MTARLLCVSSVTGPTLTSPATPRPLDTNCLPRSTRSLRDDSAEHRDGEAGRGPGATDRGAERGLAPPAPPFAPLPPPRDPPSSSEPLATNGTLCRGRDAAKRELV